MRFYLIFFILLFSLLWAPPTSAQTTSVIVRNQLQFDDAVKDINSGKEMSIQLLPGNYMLKSSITAKKPLRIIGNGAELSQVDCVYYLSDAVKTTSTHFVCKLDAPIDAFSLFFDQNGNLIPVSESVGENGVNATNKKIVGNNNYKSGIEIKIPITDNLTHLASKSFSNAFGYFDCGWTRCPIKVNRADKNYLYCETTASCTVGDFSYDISAYKKDLRYVIYNVEIKPDYVYYDDEFIYIPKSIKSLSCVKNHNKYSISAMSDIVLSGLKFNMFHGISISSKSNSICDIRRCSFNYTIATALDIIKENAVGCNPVVIDGCDFNYCSLAAGNVIKMQSQFKNHRCINILNNKISRYTDGMSVYKNCNGIVSISADALIQGNTIYNTSRNHLHLYKGEIEIVDNVIYNSQEFNLLAQRNLSSDFGLIYCGYVYQDNDAAMKNTTDVILIKDNYVHGSYAYCGDGRGIMIDDGRGDVTCERNLILDTQYFSIDSREVPRFVGSSSVRNYLIGNIVDNKYRLESGIVLESNNKARANGNVLLGVTSNTVKNSSIEKEDYFSTIGEQFSPQASVVAVPKKVFKAVKKDAQLKGMKRFFKVR